MQMQDPIFSLANQASAEQEATVAENVTKPQSQTWMKTVSLK